MCVYEKIRQKVQKELAKIKEAQIQIAEMSLELDIDVSVINWNETKIFMNRENLDEFMQIAEKSFSSIREAYQELISLGVEDDIAKKEEGIIAEKLEWLKSIGAVEFPEPVKYIYTFPEYKGSFNLSESYIRKTSLEELKEQYQKIRIMQNI